MDMYRTVYVITMHYLCSFICQYRINMHCLYFHSNHWRYFFIYSYDCVLCVQCTFLSFSFSAYLYLSFILHPPPKPGNEVATPQRTILYSSSNLAPVTGSHVLSSVLLSPHTPPQGTILYTVLYLSTFASVTGSHVLSTILLVPLTRLPKGLSSILYSTQRFCSCKCNWKPGPQPWSCPRSPHTPPQETILYIVQYLSTSAPVTESVYSALALSFSFPPQASPRDYPLVFVQNLSSFDPVTEAMSSALSSFFGSDLCSTKDSPLFEQ